MKITLDKNHANSVMVISPTCFYCRHHNMLVMTGGKECTASEYAALFEKTGFEFVKVYPTAPLQIVEAVRV